MPSGRRVLSQYPIQSRVKRRFHGVSRRGATLCWHKSKQKRFASFSSYKSAIREYRGERSGICATHNPTDSVRR